jgi:hypothetical protein
MDYRVVPYIEYITVAYFLHTHFHAIEEPMDIAAVFWILSNHASNLKLVWLLEMVLQHRHQKVFLNLGFPTKENRQSKTDLKFKQGLLPTF